MTSKYFYCIFLFYEILFIFWLIHYFKIIIVRNTNLTDKYYGNKVLRYLSQVYLGYKTYSLYSLPQREQTLEKVAILTAEWCQPEELLLQSQLTSQLNALANQVRDHLRAKNPSHPIFGVPESILRQWQTESIEDNQFSVKESKQILDTLCDVIFKVCGFRVVFSEDEKPDIFYLNKV